MPNRRRSQRHRPHHRPVLSPKAFGNYGTKPRASTATRASPMTLFPKSATSMTRMRPFTPEKAVSIFSATNSSTKRRLKKRTVSFPGRRRKPKSGLHLHLLTRRHSLTRHSPLHGADPLFPQSLCGHRKTTKVIDHLLHLYAVLLYTNDLEKSPQLLLLYALTAIKPTVENRWSLAEDAEPKFIPSPAPISHHTALLRTCLLHAGNVFDLFSRFLSSLHRQ